MILLLARALPLLAVAAMAADTPTPTPTPDAASPPALRRVADDDDIRAVFVGKAACMPEPAPVGVGPHEFRADGAYVRTRDVANAHGRYAIADGRICVTLFDSARPDFCLAVLKSGDGYAFRLDDAPPATSTHVPVPVTPCPLPNG